MKSERQVGVGAKASGRSFGHGGAGGQIAWGDPVTHKPWSFALRLGGRIA